MQLLKESSEYPPLTLSPALSLPEKMYHSFHVLISTKKREKPERTTAVERNGFARKACERSESAPVIAPRAPLPCAPQPRAHA